MRTQKFVLDTSALTNIGGARTKLTKNIQNCIMLISKVKKKGISVYTPPSVWDELEGMLRRKRIPKKEIDRLDAWLIQKSPSRMELMIPSEFIYQYISEVRARFNKGLKEAERAVIKTKHGKETHSKVIKELRDRYRQALRKGLLDSKEDLDVLLLAKELKAGVVAKDEGIKRWAKKWGIRFIDADVFPKLLKEYLRKA